MTTAIIFKNHFVQHLQSLTKEVRAYEREEDLWILKPGISNSAGTLTLHLVGNLNHFIGAQLGQTGYVRQREKEFSDRNVPRTELLAMLEKTQSMLEKTFDAMGAGTLEKVFPLSNFGENKTVHEVLLILLAHFNYHLGQVNYHRRLCVITSSGQ